MKIYLALFLLLTCWHPVTALAQEPTAPNGAVTWREQRNWEQHYDATPLEVATSLIPSPAREDVIPIRISGVWVNRTNFNLWRSSTGSFTSLYPDIVHGYIDEADPDAIPRFKFVGDNWLTNASAKTAKALIIQAFAEWSALQAERSPVTGIALKTGLEFRMVEATHETPDPAAEIELRYEPLDAGTAATTNRVLDFDGVVEATKLSFNSLNDWWFGSAATTPENQMHFYSSALHEVGHIVGLWESTDPTSVMICRRQTGAKGPTFDHLDEASKRVAYALYSIPADAPVHPRSMIRPPF